MAEGVGVLTLLPVTSPAFPFLLYLFPTISAHPYTPPQDPLVLGDTPSFVVSPEKWMDTKSAHVDLPRLVKF